MKMIGILAGVMFCVSLLAEEVIYAQIGEERVELEEMQVELSVPNHSMHQYVIKLPALKVLYDHYLKELYFFYKLGKIKKNVPRKPEKVSVYLPKAAKPIKKMYFVSGVEKEDRTNISLPNNVYLVPNISLTVKYTYDVTEKNTYVEITPVIFDSKKEKIKSSFSYSYGSYNYCEFYYGECQDPIKEQIQFNELRINFIYNGSASRREADFDDVRLSLYSYSGYQYQLTEITQKRGKTVAKTSLFQNMFRGRGLIHSEEIVLSQPMLKRFQTMILGLKEAAIRARRFGYHLEPYTMEMNDEKTHQLIEFFFKAFKKELDQKESK